MVSTIDEKLLSDPLVANAKSDDERLVNTGDPAKRDVFLGMLAAGSSKSPLEILEDAGVDLTEPTAVEAAARLMAETLKQMEALLAKSAPARG